MDVWAGREALEFSPSRQIPSHDVITSGQCQTHADKPTLSGQRATYAYLFSPSLNALAWPNSTGSVSVFRPGLNWWVADKSEAPGANGGS